MTQDMGYTAAMDASIDGLLGSGRAAGFNALPCAVRVGRMEGGGQGRIDIDAVIAAIIPSSMEERRVWIENVDSKQVREGFKSVLAMVWCLFLKRKAYAKSKGDKYSYNKRGENRDMETTCAWWWRGRRRRISK